MVWFYPVTAVVQRSAAAGWQTGQWCWPHAARPRGHGLPMTWLRNQPGPHSNLRSGRLVVPGQGISQCRRRSITRSRMSPVASIIRIQMKTVGVWKKRCATKLRAIPERKSAPGNSLKPSISVWATYRRGKIRRNTGRYRASQPRSARKSVSGHRPGRGPIQVVGRGPKPEGQLCIYTSGTAHARGASCTRWLRLQRDATGGQRPIRQDGVDRNCPSRTSGTFHNVAAR